MENFMTICGYIWIYVIILSGSIFISYCFKKKASQTIPVSILTIMFVLYLFGLIGQLKMGTYMIAILYPIMAIGALIRAKLKRELKDLKSNILTSGLIVFTILFVIFSFSTYEKLFTAADDYNYWSMAAKNMYYLDDFITNDHAIIRTVYPPVPTLLQYFFEKIIGQNRQGIELFASMLLGFSLLLPLLKNNKKKRKVAVLAIGFLILAIPAIFTDSWFYGMIYVDTLIGLLVGYILLEYYTSSKDSFCIFSIGMALFTLCLIKPTGFFIGLITIFTLICDYLIQSIVIKKPCNLKQWAKEFFQLKSIKVFLIFLFVCIVAFGSWEIDKNCFTNAEGTFVSAEQDYEDGGMIKYFIRVLAKTVLGTDTGSPDVISNINIFDHLFGSTVYSRTPIELPAGTWFGIFAIASVGIYQFLLKDKEKQTFMTFIISVFVGTLVYLCFTQAIYILRFPNFEAVSHASIERYVGSYLITMLFVIVGIVINYYNKQEKYHRGNYILVAALIFIVTPIQPIANLTIVSGAVNAGIKNDISYMLEMTENIKNITGTEAKIYAFDQNANKSEDITKFKYYMYPILINTPVRFDEQEDEDIAKSVVEEWKKLLYNQYEYVSILDVNEYFSEYFKDLFEDGKIYSWTLYKVEKLNGKEDIILKPIYSQENKSY